MKDKKIKKKLSITDQEQESMELLQKSKIKKGKQLRIDIDKGDLREINELRELIGKDFENPDEKYKTYYVGIRRVLMMYLPKGKDFKQERDFIYDEKNIFLNNGKKKSDNNGVRKSDGRMTLQSKMNEMLDVIVSWVSTSQDPNNLYNMLYDLNEKHGYGHEEYDITAKKYHKSRKQK